MPRSASNLINSRAPHPAERACPSASGLCGQYRV